MHSSTKAERSHTLGAAVDSKQGPTTWAIPCAFPGYKQGTGSEAEKRGLIWDGGTAEGGLAYYTTALAPNFFS